MVVLAFTLALIFVSWLIDKHKGYRSEGQGVSIGERVDLARRYPPSVLTFFLVSRCPRRTDFYAWAEEEGLVSSGEEDLTQRALAAEWSCLFR